MRVLFFVNVDNVGYEYAEGNAGQWDGRFGRLTNSSDSSEAEGCRPAWLTRDCKDGQGETEFHPYIRFGGLQAQGRLHMRQERPRGRGRPTEGT